MPVPSITGTPKADKIRYLIENSQLRHVLLRERVPVPVLRSVVSRDDGKYFVVHHRRNRIARLKGLHGNTNGLLNGMQKVIEAPTFFARDDFESFLTGKPMGLFEIVRLHECLTWPGLGPAEDHVLRDFRLRAGIDPRSVVPVIRLFDPASFGDALRRSGGSVSDLASAISEQEEIALSWVQTGLEHLRKGYMLREVPSGRYRITKRHAKAIHDGLTTLASAAGAEIPQLDDLFSWDPIRHEFGTRLGTKPLGGLDGAIY